MSFVVAGLFQHQLAIAFKNLLERVQRAMLKRLHRPLSSPKRGGDLLVGHIGEELQRQHLLLVLGKLGDRLLERHPVEDRVDCVLPVRVDQLQAFVERGRDRPLAPRLADQHIAGDGVEPAQKRFLASELEPPDTFDNPDEYLLSQVLGTFLLAQTRIQVTQNQAGVPRV